MSHILAIGGVTFFVKAPAGASLSAPGAFSEPFRVQPTARTGVPEESVEVILHRDVPVPLEGRPILFDTGESWFAQQDGEELVLYHRGSNAGRDLLWSARLSADRKRVDIVCGDPLWIEGPNPILHDPFTYPLDQLLTMMVLAKRQRGAILHAAGVMGQQSAVACVGVSGAGKSTLVRHLGDAFDAVSDDRVIVRVDGAAGTVMFGSPWAGEGSVARAEAAPLAALAFLRQAPSTRVRRLGKAEALRLLLPALSVPWFEERAADDVLGVAEQLLVRVPSFELQFRPDPEVRRVMAPLF